MKLAIVPWLNQLINELWKNKNKIIKDEEFNYPNYGYLSDAIADKLTSDQVDLLQENLFHLFEDSKNKRDFAENLLELLTYGIVYIEAA